jgi:hypothetical protein
MSSMQSASDHFDNLSRLAEAYRVPPGVLEDLVARRRAGAHDSELRLLLTQADRGGLDPHTARTLVAQLPAR